MDVQRQILQSDGEWPEAWASLNEDEKWKVLDLMPEADEELVPVAARPELLVDPLPQLKAGYWSGVHVARLVPSEAMKVAEEPAFNGGGGGGRGQMEGGGGLRTGGSQSSMAGSMRGAGGGNRATDMGGMSRGSDMGGMSRGSEGGSGGATEEAVPANAEKAIMLRSLDFAVEPNTTYRYRVRLVVKNPNYDRSDINPGVNTSDEDLVGEWSEPTVAVSVPADVSTYARDPAPNDRRDDVINFQVVRWNPSSGQTVVKTDDAGPGFLIGEFGSVLEPSTEGAGAKSVAIDFNSRSFVLDAQGGRAKIPDIGLERNTFVIPAMALVVEPDGAVVIRNQAIDKADEIRQDMEANYDQAIKESTKKREKGGSMGRMGGQGGSQSSAGASSMRGGRGGQGRSSGSP